MPSCSLDEPDVSWQQNTAGLNNKHGEQSRRCGTRALSVLYRITVQCRTGFLWSRVDTVLLQACVSWLSSFSKPNGHLSYLLFSVLEGVLERETGDKTWVPGLSSVWLTFNGELFHVPKSDPVAARHRDWTGSFLQVLVSLYTRGLGC